MQTIGNRIKKERIKLNLSQKELADLTNISLRSITSYENNITKPKKRNIYLLAINLKVSVEYLEYGKDCGNINLDYLLNQVISMFNSDTISKNDKDKFFSLIMKEYTDLNKRNDH